MNTGKPLIFIVDDVADNIQVAISHLQELDCEFAYALSGEQALSRIAVVKPQLILMDVMMPGLSGFDTVVRLRQNPYVSSIPIIFLTARADAEDVVRGFNLGGVDYITKPFNGMELRSRVRNHLELFAYRTRLQDMVEERTYAIEQLKDVVIEAMGEMAEYRDRETGGHIRRTMEYVRILAETLALNGHYTEQLTRDNITILYKSAPLHDIGKVAIPDRILLKPGPLTPEEYAIMKNHTIYGEEMVNKLEQMAGQNTAFLKCAKEICGAHHERFDGSGYPRGLAGTDIPLAGRLMTIADIYDALICKRVYKPALPHSQAIAIITEQNKKDFDPVVLEALLQVQDEFRAIATRFAD
ncbi:MAG: response regulator [Desulfobulbaceae bacterium]|nr:response regulator [Desulfobulbaceae bacterium]